MVWKDENNYFNCFLFTNNRGCFIIFSEKVCIKACIESPIMRKDYVS